ncbi:MAG: DUF2169 domain-containing protein [Gammaproteobacteria bacterium]
MLQIENRSPFQPGIALFPDERGVDTLYVAIKGTFSLRGAVSLAEEQLPLLAADEYWQEPGESSLRYAADVQLAKPSTDVALVAQAWAPRDKPVNQMDVRVTVAEKSKTLRVFGNRLWNKGAVGAPATFERMPIVYEYAFGDAADERNPVGRGFRGQREDKELDGQPLPNIEDPQCLMAQAGDKAVPAGFGFVAPGWLSRRQYAGTYDDAWQSSRAPYLPTDFNSRFLNTAHPDLIFDRYLTGGETVQLLNLSARGPLNFKLPTCQLSATINIAGSKESPPLNLDTVLIEPEADRFSMTWRTQLACDKKALRVERVDIDLLSMDLA